MRSLLAVVAATGFVACVEDLAVVSTTPLGEATDVALDTNVVATFNQSIDPATIDANTFRLSTGGLDVSCARSTMDNATTAMLLPNGLLAPATRYTATVSTGVTDSTGTALSAEFTWNFTTTGGGGGPGGGGDTGGGAGGGGGNGGGSAGGTAGGAAGGVGGGTAGGSAGGSGGSGGSGVCRTYATSYVLTTVGGSGGMETHNASFDIGTLRLNDTAPSGTSVWRYASVAKFVDEAQFLEGLGGPIDQVVTGAQGGTSTTTPSYDGQGRRIGYNVVVSASGMTFTARTETYSAWDGMGRPVAGSADSFSGMSGEYCSGLSISFSYDDAQRKVTRVDSGGTTHSSLMVDWCAPVRGTHVVTYDSRFITTQAVHTVVSGTITDTWNVLSTGQVCK